MKIIFSELKATDEESRQTFLRTLFTKMHLSLDSIKYDNFAIAEQNIEYIKSLLEYEGAAETFVNSPDFYTSGMNGMLL